MKLNVILMRREPLSPDERAALQKAYPGAELRTSTAKPNSSAEWLRECEASGTPANTIVILPGEEPLPLPAMRQGYRHIAMLPTGPMQLVSVQPNFTPIEPLPAAEKIKAETA